MEQHYTLTRLQGWLTMVNAPRRIQPQTLTRNEIKALSKTARQAYDEARLVWHANLGPIHTPQLKALHDGLAEIVDANRQDGDRNRPAALVDAYPGLGKTTAVLAYARDYHRRQIIAHGDITPEGHRRVPVVYLLLSGNTQVKGLNEAICRFYGLPTSGTTDRLAARAADAAISMATRLIVIDDVHFLDVNRADARAMANHLKFLANAFPVTLIYIGVGVAVRGILHEGLSEHGNLYAQISRRTTVLPLPPFTADTDSDRQQWRRLLLTIEQRLVLAGKFPGMLADDLSDYLFARSTGHFASLMTLLARGCLRAIRTGTEVLTVELMDKVNNDAAAEQARTELAAAIQAGLFSTRTVSAPSRRLAPAAS
jgi:hypothetical protein